MDFLFTEKSIKDFSKLDKNIQLDIINKIKFIKNSNNIFFYTKKLTDLLPATHRLRLGNYRLLLSLNNDNFLILKIAHRRDIYK